MPPAFKPAYLIHGDDHGRIAERRTRLRAVAENQAGAGGVEVLAGDVATPEAVADALCTLTFALGRRFIVVDGVERWKEKDLPPLLAAMKDIPPETTVTFFAREEGRLTAPSALHAAVKQAGGDIAAEQNVKPWELPRWVAARGRELGLELSPDAARALVAGVGDRQQRLMRELEKLALDLVPAAASGGGGPGAPEGAGVSVDAADVLELTAASSERKAWTLADALLSGDAAHATRTYLHLRGQGERLPGLIYWIGSRLRQAHAAAVALEQGQAESQVKRTLRMPPKAADQLISDARRAGVDRLRSAIVLVADLELASRGGGSGGASEDTRALIAIGEIAG